MNDPFDYFWHSEDGWRYSRAGVKVGPFDKFADAAEDYYEPDVDIANTERVVDVVVDIAPAGEDLGPLFCPMLSEAS